MRIVILAGGSGSRLWPMSRKEYPKQFCHLITKKTMLEDTLERVSGDFPQDKIYIATTQSLVKDVKKILPVFPESHLIIEPSLQDTGPAMGYSAVILGLQDENEPMAFVPSDHYIGRREKFINSLREAEKVIQETGKLVDISIYPTDPNTALGYTKVGELKREQGGVNFFEFLGHTEKPDFKTAQRYLEEGGYFWHANYYMWTPKLFLEAYAKHSPGHYQKLMEIKEELMGDAKPEKIASLYSQMEKISIDYAIMEKMDPAEVLIIQGDFDWKDIGAWDTLHENLMTKTDERRNLVRGEQINIDTSGSIIYGQEGKVIATIGVDDMVIIDTKDALLVCPKSRAQEVKKVIEVLKERGNKFI